MVMEVLVTSTLSAQDQTQQQDQHRLMIADGVALQIRDQDKIRLQNPLNLHDRKIITTDGIIRYKV
jgi:hypothetical protein